MNRQISHEEVKKHADQKSSWIIIHNDVYDVTKFLDEHPGGAETLLEYAGKDGTQAFEDVAHSNDARELMKKYKIGTIPPGEQVPIKKKGLKCCVPSQVKAESKSEDCCEPKHVPKKTWRNFDGGSLRSGVGGSGGGSRHSTHSGGSIAMLPGQKTPKEVCGQCSAPRGPGPCGVCASSGPKSFQEPRILPRVKSVVVPPDRERHAPIEEPGGGKLKWVLIALAAAVVIGIAIKKFKS